MSSSLRILHLEDNSRDAELIHALLEADGLDCTIRHVKNREEFEAAIEHGAFDVILSDFALPNYNGLSALSEAQSKAPSVPFILLSGTVGEEVAVQSLKTGATDYILKQRPARLTQAIRRALEECAERAKRQAAEVRVREQAALLDKAQDAIHVRDMSDRIRFWNRGCERVYGWTTAEALGKNVRELFSGESSPEPAAAKTQVITSGEWMGELQQTTKDGRTVTVESRWTLVRDHLGNPRSILVINTDITEKKQIEAQFLRTQRMETIGALAAGIVHDLNNVLAPVLMAADVLASSQTSDESRQMLNLVRMSAQRGREMLQQILSFTRGVSGVTTLLSPAELVRDIVRLTKDTFPGRVLIETFVAENLPAVRGNATQMHQVLLNLCVNARDAVNGNGKITIRAEEVHLENFSTRWQRDQISGAFVRLTVADTGHGISPQHMEKLFQPFFTTKEIGNGTGLGLSTVLAIVKHHSGFIDVQSAPGQGTRFMVYLPQAEQTTPLDGEIPNLRIQQRETISMN
jgi:PAS domain S-box-containing protein